MILTVAVSGLMLYFALFLGISGLAKVDRPLTGQGIAGSRRHFAWLLFSPGASRVLGAFEMTLAVLIAFGIQAELVVIANVILFSAFLLLKLYLMSTRLGSTCGCFGAHELIAVDRSSTIASALVLGLAIILAVLARLSSEGGMNWIVGSIYLMAFGWIVLGTLRRRRLENQAMQLLSASPRID